MPLHRRFSFQSSKWHSHWHWILLIAIAVGGALLRFWQLDLKPLWLDEVITALISLGHSYRDVPLDTFFPLDQLSQIFTLQPGVSCADITQTLITESVHPPVFFCLLHRWMSWLNPSGDRWILALRALPALFGVGAIGAVYWLNRLAVSASAGLMAAALMAVSPFAVYLSQEARHYTLPMLLITLALVGLIQIQQDLSVNSPERKRRLRPWVWLLWLLVNSLGLYVHYFFVLALVAQVAALGGWMIARRHDIPLRDWALVGLTVGGIGITYLPWLPTLIEHFDRPETDWLQPTDPGWGDRIAPLYQTLIGWVLMVVALPVEAQPLPVAIPMTLLMLAASGWLFWQAFRGIRQLWRQSIYRPALVLLLSFTGIVLLEFFVIVYGLNKDITAVPRYNFVYYPGVYALLGASLVHVPDQRTGDRPSPQQRLHLSSRQIQTAAILIGLCSSLFVVNNVVFLKSYQPDQIAQDMVLDTSRSLAVVMTYESLQDVALGLSVALEVRDRYPSTPASVPVQVAFLNRESGFRRAWQNLAQLPQPLPLPLNLWVAAPGLRAREYPERLRLSASGGEGDRSPVLCKRDPEHYNRIGFPYQLYRCR